MSDLSINFIAKPSEHIEGEITVPGDKSISHRAIMFGSLAQGTTHVDGFLTGEDCLSTMKAFQAMGVIIEGPDEHNRVVVHGKGLHGLSQPHDILDVGNSGTSIRLLAGILAGQKFATTMQGDVSLNKRPMQRVAMPLSEMGADISTSDTGTPPVVIKPLPVGRKLQAINYHMPMASAQVKSCVLLAGLYADGVTTVEEPGVTRDHTERMLQAFGYPVTVEGNKVSITGGHQLTACDIVVPGDISSATFFMVAALIAQQGSVLLKNVGINPTRIGALNILQQMGGNIVLVNQRIAGGEPVADIQVTASKLQGIDIEQNDVPLAIDEFPAIFIAAACAKGTTRLRGAKELRVKESDRIQAMADGLATLGIDCTVYDDGIDIIGGQLQGGSVETFNDHRIAMSFTIASVAAKAPILVKDCGHVATSFPNFVTLAQQLGLQLAVDKNEK